MKTSIFDCDVIGSEDTLVKLWNLSISDFVADLRGHFASITSVDMAGDEAFIASGSKDATVKIWSLILACVITDYKVNQNYIQDMESHIGMYEWSCGLFNGTMRYILPL